MCSEYTTQMYTKGMQDFMDMTVEDFQEDQVLNLDEDPASNFAVFNDRTVQIGSSSGTMTDNGGGKYTVTDAGAAFTSLKAGDTFSYTAPDGTVSIIKVRSIQKDGGTVTIIEDADVELEDVFDYVKLEGGYQQESGEPRASIGFEESCSKTERFDWTKQLGSGDLTATLKASGALMATPYIKLYLTWNYQYVELKLTMTANFDCSASGRLARQSVDLLPEKLVLSPTPGIEITFMPRLEFEASGTVSFAAELVTVIGFRGDGKNGLVNTSSGPELTRCDFHVEATVYLGLGLKPGVEIGVYDLDVGTVHLDLQVGAQITGRMNASLGTEERVHLCRACIAGDITAKLKLDAIATLAFIGEQKLNLVDRSYKLTDFYYSFDYNEFGWTTCPHMGSKPIAQGTCGPRLEWRLSEDGVLTVSGTGDMTSWPPSGGVPWDGYRQQIKSVILESGVTSVGAYAFSGCYNMERAEIPDGVAEIGDYAFYSCSSLAEIVLPGSVSYIGNYVFGGCRKLISANIPAGITTVNQCTFLDCSSLVEIRIPDSVRVIGQSAFSGCIGLTTVTLGQELTDIRDQAFYNCSSLKRIDIPDKVSRLRDSAFYGCNSLADVDLGNGVTEIGQNAFYNCTRLDSITFPSSLTKIQSAAFWGCTRLSRIQFTGNAPSMGYSAQFVGVVATVYYPANDDTWTNKIGDYHGGTFTWVPYDPDSPQSAGPEISEPSAQEGFQSVFSDAVFENAGAPDLEEEQPDVGSAIFQEDPNANANIIETAPPTVQASAPVFASAAGTVRAANPQTAQFAGLMPGGDYVLLVSKDLNGAGLLQPSNLLYIAQGRADRRGSLSFAYIPRTDESAEAKVYGLDYEAKDIGDCTATLSKSSYVYDGKEKKPEVTVKDGSAILEKDVDYTISYKKNIDAGTASVIVTGSGGYTGIKSADFIIRKAAGAVTASNITRTASKKAQSFSIGARAKGGAKLSYKSDTKSVTVDGRGKVTVAKNFTGRASITITASATANYNRAVKKITITVRAVSAKPAKTALTSASVSARSRKMALRWKKAANATGYQIQYATDRKLRGAKTLNVPGGAKTSKTIGKLAKGKKYYVRIRAYRKTGGKVVYSGWSGIRQTTMKK